jgi:hypothetical protein
MQCFSNLFKKVSLLVRTHQIPLDAFLVALRMMKVDDIDSDETECILVTTTMGDRALCFFK